tara:strand:- start:542 stop:733 length:192 start_codon:yes stop_codon:yes gene_type:complete
MSKPKEYKVSFMPYVALQYDYVVEAKDEDEAYDKGRDELRYAIGRDASKDWECLDIKEIKDEC